MLPTVLHTYQNHHLDSLRWQRYIPRPGDIVISTSLKSGTTLTQEIVGHLVFNGQDVDLKIRSKFAERTVDFGTLVAPV